MLIVHTMEDKKRQLRKYKAIATGLFILMAVVFILSTIYQKSHQSAHWIGYIKAFSEAAMVGALADWFAVTALFHHPLGLKIPHTNLIEKSKSKIGDNLGSFVVSNFLSPQNIRPYIQQLKVSHIAGDWLAKPHNQQVVVSQVSSIMADIIHQLEDDKVIHFMTDKAMEMTAQLKFNQLIGSGLDYILQQEEHQKLITHLSLQIKDYIINHQNLVRERVKKESFSLIPKFVDDAIADKITMGLAKYFEEVEQDLQHSLRNELTLKMTQFSDELKSSSKWEQQFDTLKKEWLKKEKLSLYITDIWASIKKSIISELEHESSALKSYLYKNLDQLSHNLKTDPQLQNKIDGWVRRTAYTYILKNTHRFGGLISSTVGNWEGKELSNKLELEVGKDLQFIRVNGTLVGGLVGLVIYTITHFFI